MSASCVACRTRGPGMIAIHHHPNGLDQMFTSVTGIEVETEDHLCIPCYDDLKAAHIFKQKCIQNNILRISRPSTTRAGRSHQGGRRSVAEEEEEVVPPLPPPALIKEIKPEVVASGAGEISTTSVEADILEEHLEISSDVEDDEEEDLEDIQEEEEEEEEEEDVVEDVKVTMDDLMAVESNEIIPSEQEKPEVAQEVVVQSTHEPAIDIVDEVKLEPIRCDECDKVFRRAYQLQKHMKTCHKAESAEEDGEQLAPGALATLPAVHSLMCEFCYQEFTALTEKFEHETAHLTESKPYKCPQCQSEFKDKVGLRSHIRIHSAVKRYKCQYCEMRFHQRGNLTAHERTHVGDKPFLCPQCGKGFAESGNLKNHIRYHTGERPYACTECPKRFRTHYSRTVHYRSHNNERPFRCPECEKGFYSSGKLIIHRRVHTGEKPYKCDSCPAKFADSSGLKRHSKTH